MLFVSFNGKLSSLVALSVITVVLIYSKTPGGKSPQRAADEAETTNPRLGVITGRVVADGQPVDNATVTVSRLNSSGQWRSVSTNNEGKFQIKGLEPGLFRIQANAPGYVSQPSTFSEEEELHRIGGSVTINLVRGGVITGKVVNAADEPVVAVRVRAIMIRDAANKKSPSGLFRSLERQTDDRGIYRLYGLLPGTYIVSAGGFSSYWDSAYTSKSPTYAPSSTRDTADEISVTSGEETKDINIRYRGELGNLVTGSATGAAGANARLNIILARVRNGIIEDSLSTSQNVNGKGFEFQGVPDGEYEIWAGSASTSGEIFASETRRITIKGADITGIKLVIKPLPSLTGQLFLVDSKVPNCKGRRRPNFEEMLVTARSNSPQLQRREQFFNYFPGQVSPNKTGEFQLRNLQPGQFTLNIRFFARYWYFQSIIVPLPTGSNATSKPRTSNEVIDSSRNWIVLKPGDRIAGLKIILAEGAASVQGMIELKDGEKLPRALNLTLVPAETENRENVMRFFATSVGDDGRFRVSNIPPGRYFVMARVMQNDELEPFSRLRLPDQNKTRAMLRRDAEAARTEIELKPCQNLTGLQIPVSPR
jgi:hypothetical protein